MGSQTEVISSCFSTHPRGMAHFLHMHMTFCLTNPCSPNTLPTAVYVKGFPDTEIWHVEIKQKVKLTQNSVLMNHKNEKIL